MMCPLESICDKVTCANVHLSVIIKQFLNWSLQKRHHMHPQHMRSFPLLCLLHILKKKSRVFDGLLRSRHKMAHEKCIDFIGQRRNRIMFPAQRQLRRIIIRSLITIINRFLYGLLRDLFSCHIL